MTDPLFLLGGWYLSLVFLYDLLYLFGKLIFTSLLCLSTYSVHITLCLSQCTRYRLLLVFFKIFAQLQMHYHTIAAMYDIWLVLLRSPKFHRECSGRRPQNQHHHRGGVQCSRQSSWPHLPRMLLTVTWYLPVHRCSVSMWSGGQCSLTAISMMSSPSVNFHP